MFFFSVWVIFGKVFSLVSQLRNWKIQSLPSCMLSARIVFQLFNLMLLLQPSTERKRVVYIACSNCTRQYQFILPFYYILLNKINDIDQTILAYYKFVLSSQILRQVANHFWYISNFSNCSHQLVFVCHLANIWLNIK